MTNYSISIDLGTTTLAFLDNRGCSFTAQNHQSAFGADVISRIKAAMEGQLPLLSSIIKKDLSQGIKTLLQRSDIRQDSDFPIVIAANTTMVHLLMGYSCQGLSSYPFSPASLELIELPGKELSLFGSVTLLPGASAFIGGDILSGLFSLKAHTWEKPCLLLDLGTNGEMVLGTGERLFSASAAAGPALEGGGISCGLGGIKGAVCHFSMDKSPAFQTIAYGRPIGICGTGIVDITAELLSHGLMDKTGLLAEPYFSQGFPVTQAFGNFKPLTLTQADIRQVQMAKAAVCTGIQLLCKEAGISFSQIGSVFLAGGLGCEINLKNAASIGLFPKELLPKIQTAGNTSLSGATAYASNPAAASRHIKKIRNSITCLELANLPEFQDLYISNLNFPS